jgi:hypothetical protein
VRIATIVYRAPEFHIELDSGSFRLVPGTASNPLLMNVPPQINYPPPFSLSPGTTDFRITTRPGGLNDSFEVTFFRMPVASDVSIR